MHVAGWLQISNQEHQLCMYLATCIVPNVTYSKNLCFISESAGQKYHKQLKLSGRKVLRFDRICENVEKTFMILLPLLYQQRDVY